MFVMLPSVYTGVRSPNIYRGLWQSSTLITLVTVYSEAEDFDHF